MSVGPLSIPCWTWLVALVTFLAGTEPAQAYIGPGSGITVFGALLGVIGAILFMLVGILLWPLRLLLRRLRAKPTQDTADNGDDTLPDSRTHE